MTWLRHLKRGHMPKGITAPSKLLSIRTLMNFHLDEYRQLSITMARLEEINDRYLESQMDLDNLERLENVKV